MSKLRGAIAAASLALGAVGATTPPAHAFPCPVGTSINTGPVGVAGIATIQVCSEGVRILPTGEITTVVQVGVTILGDEECVGIGRVVVDTNPLDVYWDTSGLFGTPLFLTCPGS